MTSVDTRLNKTTHVNYTILLKFVMNLGQHGPSAALDLPLPLNGDLDSKWGEVSTRPQKAKGTFLH